MKSRSRNDAVLAAIERTVLYGAAIAFAAMMIITVIDIIMRYFLNAPLSWSSELFIYYLCVGQHAARLQASCLLEKLIPKVEKIEVACEHGVRCHRNNALRGWASIPLRFTLA